MKGLQKGFLLVLVTIIAWIPMTGLVQAENQAFRNVQLGNPQLQIKVAGEAKVWEATYHYRVKADGHTVAEGYGTASTGAPNWGSFSEEILIAKKKLIGKKNMTLELYEVSMKDGSEIHKLTIPLDQLDQTYQNKAFRNLKVEANMLYPISGEARVFEATYQYEASDGHYVLTQGYGTASQGAPAWGTFHETIVIPYSRLPVNGSVVLELYEQNMSDEGPERLHSYFVRLDQLPW